MDHRNVSTPIGPLVRAVAVGLGIATLCAGPALAQAPQQQPKPGAASRPTTPPGKDPQLLYSPWIKLCGEAENKKVCVTAKEGRMETGLLLVTAAIYEPQGENPERLLRVSVPYGVNLQYGTRVIIDDTPPSTAPYVACLPPVVPPGGCIADYKITKEVIDKMKGGKLLTIQAVHMSNQPMSLTVPLDDLAKAYDGPPTDPKVFQEQQQKLQEELQRKAEEARKRLEGQQQPKQ
jgi:invasion protein IalB